MPIVSGAVSVTSVSATQIVLAGAVATGGSGTYTYLWLRSTDGGSTWISTGNTTPTSYTDSSVSSGQLYAYKLQSVDTGAGNTTVESATIGPVMAFTAQPQGGGNIVSGIYNTTPPTLSNGQSVGFQLDQNGNLEETLGAALAGEDLATTQGGVKGVIRTVKYPFIGANYTTTPFTNSYLTTAATKGFAKASAGNLYSFDITNANAAVRYLCFFNKASAPVAGTDVPVYSFLIPAGTATIPGSKNINDVFFAQIGDYFATGIAWAISTTTNFAADSATAAEHVLNGRIA
jgi:hypothetical protein